MCFFSGKLQPSSSAERRFTILPPNFLRFPYFSPFIQFFSSPHCLSLPPSSFSLLRLPIYRLLSHSSFSPLPFPDFYFPNHYFLHFPFPHFPYLPVPNLLCSHVALLSLLPFPLYSLLHLPYFLFLTSSPLISALHFP